MTIKWTQNEYGNGSRAILSSILILSVSQNIGTRGGPPPKWRASVFGASLKNEYDNSEDAKCAAEKVARKQLTMATETIE